MPGPAGRLRDVGPPRLGVQGRVQRGAHPGHDRGHLPLPAPPRATAVRCSSAATRTRCPSPPGGRRSRCWRRTGSTSGSTPTTGSRRRPPCRTRSWSRTAGDVRAGGLADGIVVTPSHNPPEDGGFKYNPPNGGPADTDVTRWIQDEANRILEASGADGLDGDRARAVRAGASAGRRATTSGHLRRRPRQRRGHGGDRRIGTADRRRPARRRGRRLLGRRSGSGTGST